MTPDNSLFKLIDNLVKDKHITEKKKNGNLFSQLTNPMSEIITPEWFYSDSFRILENESLTWERLDESLLIKEVVKSLSDTDKKYTQIGKDFEKSFCCWYQAYHYLPRIKWGIHIRYNCLVSMALDLKRNKNNLQISTDIEYAKSAFLYFYVHCMFHYLIENIVSTMELILDDPLLYLKYISDVYNNTFNTDTSIEEALANKFVLDFVEDIKMNRQYLKNRLIGQGEGYREFVMYEGKDFDMGLRKLLYQIKHGYSNIAEDRPIEQVFNCYVSKEHISITNVVIPIWIHYSPLKVHKNQYY